jgi:benzoylformate decarboxylase
VFVIFSNREYRILKHNVDVWRQKFKAGTQHPYQQMDMLGLELDFVHWQPVAWASKASGSTRPAACLVDGDRGEANRPFLVEIALEGKTMRLLCGPRRLHWLRSGHASVGLLMGGIGRSRRVV